MNEQWVVLSRGGGSEERPDEFRARGPFPSFEAAEHWMTQEFKEEERDYFDQQVVRIEDPKE